MNRLLLVATLGVAFAIFSPGFAQTTPPPAAPAGAPPTTIPDGATYQKWPNIILNLKKEVADLQGKSCSVIFIGDSITARFLTVGKPVWDKMYAPLNALDFGVNGDRTQNVLWRFDHIDLSGIKPKVAVILIGTNNRLTTPENIAAGVKAVIDKTQATFPGIKVILVSLMPRYIKTQPNLNQTLMATNAIIKGYADNASVYYLDLVPLMPATPDGIHFKGLGQDVTHPDVSGYQLWADAMQPLLTRLLAGN